MYYKLRCNSTQFVIYYTLRNYYKLQRNNACIAINWWRVYAAYICDADSDVMIVYQDNVGACLRRINVGYSLMNILYYSDRETLISKAMIYSASNGIY